MVKFIGTNSAGGKTGNHVSYCMKLVKVVTGVYSATIMMQMRQEVIGSRRESSAGLGKGRRRGSAVGSRRSRKVIKYSKPVNWSSVFPFLLTIRSEKNKKRTKNKTKNKNKNKNKNIHCWNSWCKIKNYNMLFIYLNLHAEIGCVQAKKLCNSHWRQTRWPTNPLDTGRINKGKIKLAKGFPNEKNIQRWQNSPW